MEGLTGQPPLVQIPCTKTVRRGLVLDGAAVSGRLLDFEAPHILFEPTHVAAYPDG